MSSKGLEMPVSGSDKMELPVLGCRFSEKAEHLPIKKRRFLFRTPSPPHNTSPSKTTESLATSLNSSNQEVKPQSQPLPESLKVASVDKKVQVEKSVKPSDDICGISLGSYGIKSLKPPATVKLEPNSVNMPSISFKETGLHISTMDNSISTRGNQVTSQGHKSADCDERLNWDLNTVMAWEESSEFDHNIQTTFTKGNNSCKEGSSKVCKQEQVYGTGIAPENISNKILTSLRSLTQSIHGQEPEERKPNSNHINKMLFPVTSTPNLPSPHVTVNSIKPTATVPTIVKSEYPPCPMPAGIGLSLGYSVPLVYSRAKDNVLLSTNVASGSKVKNHAAITSTTQTSENENLNLSLVTVPSLEKQVVQSGTSFEEEDDKAKVKRVISSRCENLINKAINKSTICPLVLQSPEVEHQPSSVSVAKVQIKREKLPSTPPSVTYNKEVSKVDNNLGFENSQLDMMQESEVDNVEEFSVGYDSQFEDGEVRESSIQTWEGEGSEGDNRENEHGTDNNNNMGTTTATCVSLECAPESSSRIRSSEIASQKGTDEISISSVLLPEKPDTSENVSNSQPNETDTREVSIKDESESNQWKMNVSGPDEYTKMKEVTSMKLYKREPSTRDAFINRGSRFRMQGYSSSNGEESGSRPREVRSFRRGNTKFTTHVAHPSNRGGATWNHRDRVNRDPPFFRENLTNEIPLEENDDVIRPGPPYTTRGPTFRPRLVANREEDDFRARLGLRPAGDTRFVPNQGRSVRYNGFEEPPLEYPHSFPRPPPRRCFSPTEQRRENNNNNHPCVRLHSGSTSPLRSRTRSRSPRIRRLRSPDYRFETDGYTTNNNNNNSPRWVKYKRPSGFDRSPPPPIGERLTFYDSSRKTKQSENYGRFSDAHGGVVMDHGYRRGGGGFVKRHEIGRPVKHVEYDDEEDGYGLEFHGRGRGNPKPYNGNNGSDTRFSRRGNPRGERENW